MGKGISISIAADTKDAQRGIQRGLIEPLEDATTALTDLERDGKDAGRTLERTFSDQQRETGQLRKEYDKLGDQIRTSGRRGRDFGDDVQAGTDKAKRGMDEFKDEANSTAREAAASFDGSAESAADAFQEVAANAFAGFGPAGAAAGLAAAIGLGTVLTAITEQQEAADELKARLTDAYIAAAEEGRNYLDVQQIIEESGLIYKDAERLAKATEDATRLNLDLALVIQAMAGDEEAINAVIAAGNDLRADATAKNRERGAAGEGILGVELQEDLALERVVKRYEEQLGLQQNAKANAEGYLAVVEQQNAKQSEGDAAAKRAIDVRAEALQKYADKAASIPNPVLTPRLELDTLEGDISRFIARRRSPIELDIFYKDSSGRRLLP